MRNSSDPGGPQPALACPDRPVEGVWAPSRPVPRLDCLVDSECSMRLRIGGKRDVRYASFYRTVLG